MSHLCLVRKRASAHHLVDRRPVDPPPVVELLLDDAYGRPRNVWHESLQTGY